MDATLMSMEYRGEDVSGRRADARRQQPWQSSAAPPAAEEQQWSEASGGYDQATNGYPAAGGYAADDGYAGNGGYAQQGGHASDDGYGGYADGDPYAGYSGFAQGEQYGQDSGYDYGSGSQYSPGDGYGQDYGYGYDQQPGYGQAAPEYGDNGNDWYGNQFPVTGSYATIHDPVRGFPPAPGQLPPPLQLEAGSSGLAYTGQHEVYDPAHPRTGQHEVYDPGHPHTGQYEIYDPAQHPRTGQHEIYNSGSAYTGQYEVYDPAHPRTGQHEVYDPGHPRTGQHEVYDPGHPYTGQYEVYDPAHPYTGQYEVYDPAHPRTGQHEIYDDSQYGVYPGYEGVAETEEPQGYDTAAYDADYAESEAFAAAPTYADAVGSADPRGYEDYGDDDSIPLRGDDGTGPRRTRKSRRRRVPRRILFAAVGGVVVVAAVGAGYMFLLKPKQSINNSPAAAPLPSPGSTSAVTAACQKEFGEYCHIETRKDDPKPLTLDELYPQQFFNEADHVSFARVGARLDTNCANAVIGQNLTTALQNGKCTQVLRASYVSGNNQIMGTIGIANLSDTNQAHYAGKTIDANDFIAPLSAAHGIGSKIGQGTGVVQSEFKGHYLILTWAEFTSLQAPANNTQDTELEQFESDLIAGTVNISLSQRMINGTPAAAAG
jgi:hypothetical protein